LDHVLWSATLYFYAGIYHRHMGPNHIPIHQTFLK